jgi:hypothetical protein
MADKDEATTPDHIVAGKPTTGELIGALPDSAKKLIGATIIDGLKTGRFTFNNPNAYVQGDGNYTQSDGGNHQQGKGDYNQSGLVGNLGTLDVTDLTKIIGGK